MSDIDEKLISISEDLKNGRVPQKQSVRSFLLWFGAERRGYRVVGEIRAKLADYKLKTEPDFDYTYIDNEIGFKLDEGGSGSANGMDVVGNTSDPTYSVGRLQSANTPPLFIKPDDTLQYAVTLMLTRDFSQIPVMTGSRDVKGMISWKSIGRRLALKKACATAKDCMDPAQVIFSEESFFSAIKIITIHDYVLVRAHDQQICGIVTASDFNEQFRKLAEPFLLVGEIENGIRRMLHGKFGPAELKCAKALGDDSREVESVSDLSFGEYIRLIQQENDWKKLRLEIDRVEFIKRLDKIREIRNDVMHFDPDGLEEGDLITLREFAGFLKCLRDLRAV